MEGSPELIDTESMKSELNAIESVTNVHDFHVWSLSRGKYVMSCHIKCKGDKAEILDKATEIIKQYGIDHSTIQIEG